MRKLFIILAVMVFALTAGAQKKGTGVRRTGAKTQKVVTGKDKTEKVKTPALTGEEIFTKFRALVADTTGFKAEATLRAGDKAENYLVAVKNGKVYCDNPAEKSESWYQKDVIYMYVKDAAKPVRSVFVFKDDGSAYYKYNPFTMLDGDYDITMVEKDNHYELTLKDRGETSDSQYFKLVLEMSDLHPLYFIIKNEENVATYHYTNFLSGIDDREVTFDKSQFADAQFVDNRQL